MKTLSELAQEHFCEDRCKLNMAETAWLQLLDEEAAAFAIHKPTDPDGTASRRGQRGQLRGHFSSLRKVNLDEVAGRGADQSIRSQVIEWLCLNPLTVSRLKKTDLCISGERIEGELALPDLYLPFRISLRKCVLAYPFDIRRSSVEALDLSGSHTGRIYADELRVAEDVRLADGFSATGAVSFIGARINGDFVCVHGRFNNENDHHKTTRITGCKDCRGSKLHLYSLLIERAKVEGSIHLCGDFACNGGVLLADTEIGVNLNCTKGSFSARACDVAKVAKITGRRLACDDDADDHLACALNAEGMRVKRNVILNGIKVSGESRLTGACIDGDLESAKGVFRNDGGNAIHGDRLRVSGNVYFSDGFEAEGTVRLPMAQIGRDLSLTNARLTHPSSGEHVLYCNGISITGTLYLLDTKVVQGYVEVSGCDIGDNFDCTNASFLSKGDVALRAEGMKVSKSVYLSSLNGAFKSTGAINLSGSNIGMDLNCHNGEFTANACGDAICADNMTISGKVEMTGAGFKAVGRVTLDNTKIDSFLSLAQGTFTAPATPHGISAAPTTNFAISATNVQVLGSIFIDNNFSATGGVKLNGASIGRDLVCNRGHISNEREPALWAVQMKVAGSVEMDQFVSQGEVRLNNSYIGGILKCSGAKFINVFGGGREGQELPGTALKRYALQASGVQIKGSAAFDGSHADGIVSFENAEIGMRFIWKGITEPKKAILILNSLKAGVLDDEEASWPEHMEIDYFEYQFLKDLTAYGLKRRRERWLAIPCHIRSQPFEHLAAVLKQSGYEEEAKNVLIERNRRQRRLPIRWHWKARARDKYRQSQSFPRWLYLALYEFLISYGYKPARAVTIGGVFILVGWILFHIGFNNRLMAPVKEKKDSHLHQVAPIEVEKNDLLYVNESRSPFYSLIYSLDTFLPLVDLQAADYWLPLAYPPERPAQDSSPTECKANAQGPAAQKQEGDIKPRTPQVTTAALRQDTAPQTTTSAQNADPACGKTDAKQALVGKEFNLLGGILCWYRWFLIGVGWIISTLFVASLGGIVRR